MINPVFICILMLIQFLKKQKVKRSMNAIKSCFTDIFEKMGALLSQEYT